MQRTTMLKQIQLIAVGSLLAAGCVPPPPEQLPVKRLTSSHNVAETTQTATRSLVSDGFEITLSDASGGIVTAKRVRAAKSLGGNFVSCRWAHGSIAENNGEVTLTVSVTSTAAAPGSSVLISSHVQATMPSLQGGVLATPPSDTDCASTGVAEGHIAAAVGAAASP